MPTKHQTELIIKYLRTCWIIKIRLMSARKQLWDKQCSLIHLENGCIQLRKICEGTTNLVLIASEIEFEELPKKWRNNYKMGAVLKYLGPKNLLRFPMRAVLKQKSQNSGHTIWELKTSDCQSKNDQDRIIAIWNRTGQVLHERSAFKEWPNEKTDFQKILWQDLNSIRADHQFLWNFIWQHALNLKGTEIFFLDMLGMQNTSRPRIVSMDGFIQGDLSFEFDPDYYSDFSGEIDWGEFID